MTSVSAEGLTVTVAGRIATVILQRAPVNALSLSLCRSLTATISGLGADPAICVVILTGAGSRAFCAGLDLRETQETPDVEPVRAAAVRDLYKTVYQCAVPVIAAVNGPALGAGAVLASVCDVRLALPGATFGLPEITVGRIGGAAHHARVLPQGLLRRMVLTGTPLTADEAHRAGLVDEVSDDVVGAANTLAQLLAAKGRVGLAAAKRTLNAIEGLEFEAGYAIEQAENARLRETDDAKEATRAALEKRAPVFKGR